MQTTCRTSLLALGMLVVPIAGRAQTAAPKGPQPKITEIVTIPGVSVDEIVKMPNGHIVIFGDGNQRDGNIGSYDLTTKQSTIITRGWYYDLDISPQGNRIVYSPSTPSPSPAVGTGLAICRSRRMTATRTSPLRMAAKKHQTDVRVSR